MLARNQHIASNTNVICRFVECEQWRKDFNLDELVKTFDYKEKEEVFAYYPQYYHKTDKVRDTAFLNANRTDLV